MNIAVSPELAAIVKKPNGIERHKITSREQWMNLRKADVTASAAASLLGIHPYQTAYSLWATKTGRISDEIEDSPPLRRGRLLEPLAVQMLREDRPDWQVSDHPLNLYFRDPVARIGATPDLTARNEHGKFGAVQIKSVEASIFRKEWRDADGNVSPPLWIVIQAIIETRLMGLEWAAVAPIVVGHGVEMPVIEVPLHEGIYDRIKGEVAHFWRLVESGKTPDVDFGRDAALIERLYAPTGEIVDLAQDNVAPDLADEKEKLASEKSTIEDRQRAIKAELLTKLGGASGGRLRDGRLITAKRVDRKGYEVGPSSYMDLRVKKATTQGART
jgi:hypothetical protein